MEGLQIPWKNSRPLGKALISAGKCREVAQGKKTPVGKKCPPKTNSVPAPDEKAKVARAEPRASGGPHGPEKPGWSDGGMAK